MRLNVLGCLMMAALVAVPGMARAAAPTLPLIDAVKQGDIKAVRALLPKSNVNAAEVDGSTALHWAAYENQPEVVDLLIRAGGNAKATNRYGVTPLSLASIKGNAAILERLIAAGADPNASLPGGETPLMTAARTGKADAIKVLLAHGASVNARETTRGQTALMWASAEGNADAVKALIEGGADFRLQAAGLSNKAAAGDAEATRFYANMVNRRMDALTPLLFAVRRGHMDAVRVLLDAGAGVSDLAPDGSGPVSLAIANAHYELASFLLDRGASPTVATTGWTALHQLVRTRRPSIERMAPPVGYGADSGLELAKKLVARGADVNARMVKDFNDGYRRFEKRKGATPFFLAAKGVDAKMMRLLLSLGADPRMATEDGSTPLMVAAGYGDSAPNESGTDQDALAAVKVCLDATGGDDVNAINKDGWTALHGAAYRGVNAMVTLLLDKGARLDVKTDEGFTPLGVATAWAGDLQHVYTQPHTMSLLRQIMAERGMPIDGQENLGRKP